MSQAIYNEFLEHTLIEVKRQLPKSKSTRGQNIVVYSSPDSCSPLL